MPYKRTQGRSQDRVGSYKRHATASSCSSVVSSSPGVQMPSTQSITRSKLSSAGRPSSSRSSFIDHRSSSHVVAAFLPSSEERHPLKAATPNNSSAPDSSEHTIDAENEEDLSLGEDADALNEVMMSVDMRDGSTIGCAYYIAREEKLYMMDDIKHCGLDMVDTLKLHAQPTIILISSRANGALEELLSKEARGCSEDEDDGKFGDNAFPKSSNKKQPGSWNHISLTLDHLRILIIKLLGISLSPSI